MTGLVTVPTVTTWSTFGKIVILGLIQFGGLGIMACLTMVFLIPVSYTHLRLRLQAERVSEDVSLF